MRGWNDLADEETEPTYLAVAREMRETYSMRAGDYVRSTSGFSAYPGLREELIEFVDRLPAGLILDLGCGSGRDAKLVATLGRQVIRADGSLAMLKEPMVCSGAEAAVCCDICSIPFRAESFVGVIASGVLLHVPKSYCLAGLQEVGRILVRGGFATISMKRGAGEGWRVTSDFGLRRWFSYYDPDEFAVSCRDSGLVVCDIDVSFRKDWFTVTVRR